MMNFRRLIQLVEKDLHHLNKELVHSPQKLVVNVREGLEKEFPNSRDYAYTYIDDDGNYIIVFSQKMYQSDLARIRAIMRHEVAHAFHFLTGHHEHTEQETDDLAEQIWGDRIYYDDDDIQTLNHGQYPRPTYLHG